MNMFGEKNTVLMGALAGLMLVSGNVFADLGYPNAEEHQTKAKLVSQIATMFLYKLNGF